MQVRAARCVLGMSVRELSNSSGVSASSIRRLERTVAGKVTLDMRVRVQEYFEGRGIEFVFESESVGICWPVGART